MTEYIDYKEEVVTFPLWTTTGMFVGYQRYNWKADKLKNNDNKGKYYTYRRKDVLTCWGLEYIDLSSKEPLYVTEGVWDAISVMNTGRRSVAVLSNNPQQLKGLFSMLPCKVVAVCEGDKAGRMLSRVCDDSVFLPDNTDPNEMNLSDLDKLLS